MSHIQKLSKMKKGQFLSILVVVTLLFISGGSMFTTLYANHEMNRAWAIFTGDMRTVAETQMKAESYPGFVTDQARYSINNAGYELGRQSAHKDWSNTNIPEKDVLEQQFIDAVMTNSDYGLKPNNAYSGCKAPNIEDYGYNATRSGTVVGFDFDKDNIICGGNNRGFQELDFISLTDYTESVHIGHNYLDSSEYAVDIAHALNESLQDGPIYGVASDTTGCNPDSEEEDETAADARESSKDTARDKIDGTADDTLDSVDQPEHLEVETDEWASWWPPNQVNRTEEYCSIAHSHSNSSCWLNDCADDDGDPLHYYEEVDDDACEDLSEDEECNTHTHDTDTDNEVHEVKFKYNTTLASYYAEVNITDTEDQVLTHDGLKNIPFDYEYKDSID